MFHRLPLMPVLFVGVLLAGGGWPPVIRTPPTSA